MKTQKILSRKIGDTITPFELTTIKTAKGITIVDASLPTMVLVEGDPDTIGAFLKEHEGWQTDTVVQYQVPDTRPGLMFPGRHAAAR